MKNTPIAPAVPTVGRIVHVILSADLAAAINHDPAIRGNACVAGEVYPLIIARVWQKETYSDGLTVNGQLVVDGVGTYWMTSVHHGDEPGCWHWPHLDFAAELISTEVDAVERPVHDALMKKLCDDLNAANAKAQGFADRLFDAEKRLAGETAKLYDATAQAAQLTERAARLQHQNETLREDLTRVIQERDQFMATLDQVKAASAAWDAIFGKLRDSAAA